MSAWVLLALLRPAAAGGFEVAQQGAIAGGTGHATVGRTGDAALAWGNPAALADGGGLRIAAGAALASSVIEAEADPWQARSVPALGTPPHLCASYAGGPLVGGLALNTAFAGGIAWPEDSPLRFESVRSSPTFLRIAPFVGGRLEGIRVAAGVHVDTGGLSVARATDHVTEEGSVALELLGTGLGADASLQLDVSDRVVLGLTYKGRTAVALQGWADFDVPAPFAADVPDQAVSSELILPDRITAGVGLAAGPASAPERYRGYVDLSLTLWSTYQALTFDFEQPNTADVVQRNDWRNTVALRGGAEADVASVTLRLGAYLDGVTGPPGPPETLAPSSPDGTRVAGTLGAGLALLDQLRLDAFAEHLRILQRTSTSTEAPSASYRGHATIAGLTGSLAF